MISVPQEPKVQKDLLVNQEHKDTLENKEKLDLLEKLEIKEKLDLLELTDHKDYKEKLENKDHKEMRELQVYHQVLPPLDQMVPQENKDLKDLQENKDLMDINVLMLAQITIPRIQKKPLSLGNIQITCSTTSTVKLTLILKTEELSSIVLLMEESKFPHLAKPISYLTSSTLKMESIISSLMKLSIHLLMVPHIWLLMIATYILQLE